MTRSSELPLPYMPIDPMILESGRMDRFADHPKIDQDPMADAYVLRLLLYVGRSAVRGNLGGISTRKLARVCGWSGEPDDLREALIDSGWLVVSSPDTRAQLAWPDYLDMGADGDLLLDGHDRHGGAPLRDRARLREYREKKRETSSNAASNEDRTVRVQYANGTRRVEGEGEGELDQIISLPAEIVTKGDSSKNGGSAMMPRPHGLDPPDVRTRLSGAFPEKPHLGLATTQKLARAGPIDARAVDAAVATTRETASRPNAEYAAKVLLSAVAPRPRGEGSARKLTPQEQSFQRVFQELYGVDYPGA